jgi:PadR family transcriptional regulator PadR
MKRTFLGEFEEVVLLVLAACGEEAYGVVIWEQLQQQTGPQHHHQCGACNPVPTRRKRLFVLFNWAVPPLSGVARRKRLFALTALPVARPCWTFRQMRQRLWQVIPHGKLQLTGLAKRQIRPLNRWLLIENKSGRPVGPPRWADRLLEWFVSPHLLEVCAR